MAITWRLRARGMRVAPLEQRAPQHASDAYGRAFDEVFAQVVRRTGALLVSNPLAGVESDPALKQPDGLHSDARGVLRIAARVAPVVARALR